MRLEEDRLACLVIIGVTPSGSKEVIAIEDGYRESTESWATLLRDLKRRGMPAPKLATADGALGILGRFARSLSADTRTTLLGAQDSERPGQAAQAPSAASQSATTRDHART